MSGIVGILNLDGSPIDRTLLERLTNSLLFRGPDAQRTWFRDQIGVGHTLLRSTTDTTEEQQPLSLDGNTWIVSDARVDGRRELIAALQSHGQQRLAGVPDAELILRAYQVWGESCVDHLIGDFVFAIWNAKARRLFCARDQMGVKPFYYAHLGPLLVFSNTLDCIRQHPAVSSRLNDLSIADFLVFEMIQDAAATAFADIRRLPPAHLLLCGQDGFSVRRYWAPPSVTTPIHYRRPAEYVEHFNDLLDAAVADRLRTESACVFMSGGLDSPTVAASAKRVSDRNGGAPRLWAFTQVFDNLIPHDERHYAGLVAQALRLPIEYRADDHLNLFQSSKQPGYRSPEPVHSAWPDATADHLRRVSTESRVVLTGLGADPLFSSSISVHFRDLFRQKRFGRALADASRYFSAEGRFSRLYLRTRWRILFPSKSFSVPYPPWLNETLEKRLNLQDRWQAMNQTPAPATAVRPEAHQVTFAPLWPCLFESQDANMTRVPVEVRHPFFDLRLMNFLLALPRLPWCCDKQLLREAARGALPEAVRLRRKSPLRADPLVKLLAQPGAAWVDRFEAAPDLNPYVIRNRVPKVYGNTDTWTAWVHLRPLSLNYWLRNLDLPSQNIEGGLEHEINRPGHSQEAVSPALPTSLREHRGFDRCGL
jgi:asparagine synthase (glutamine-hydrolysing)